MSTRISEGQKWEVKPNKAATWRPPVLTIKKITRKNDETSFSCEETEKEWLIDFLSNYTVAKAS
jgi:hypothetical protein